MADFLLEWQFGTPDVLCASGHDTNVYWMLFMCVHVGGGAWIFIESPGNTFCQLPDILCFFQVHDIYFYIYLFFLPLQ